MNIKYRPPSTVYLIVALLLIGAALTWVIPGGSFEREIVDGRQIVDPGSFERAESNPVGVVDLVVSVYKGFTDSYAVAIILFIFVVAGAFSIIQETGVFERMIRRSAIFFHENPQYRPWFVPFFMVMFSMMGTTFGMSEEVLVFVPLFLTLSLALGYDSIVGVSIPFFGAGLGFAGAIYNPFTVGIAQGLAEIQLFSGAGFRIIMWITITFTGILMVSRYAARVYRQPEISRVRELDLSRPEAGSTAFREGPTDLSMRHSAILILFLATFIFLIYGVTRLDWYIRELTLLFLSLGVGSALISWMPFVRAFNAFFAGFRDFIPIVIVIALARSILIMLSDANVIDSILYYLSRGVADLHPILSAQAMLLVQTCINFLVPSGSGQAALTIPLMAPLGDIVGITRQTVVVVFQLGDGLTNMIIPTSAITLGVLGIARIPWNTWARWLFPKLMVLYLLAFAFIAVAVLIGLE